jgi:hypothetical protein
LLGYNAGLDVAQRRPVPTWRRRARRGHAPFFLSFAVSHRFSNFDFRSSACCCEIQQFAKRLVISAIQKSIFLCPYVITNQ